MKGQVMGNKVSRKSLLAYAKTWVSARAGIQDGMFAFSSFMRIGYVYIILL